MSVFCLSILHDMAHLFLGPMLVGAFFNAILYGVMIVQCFIYHQTYKNDAVWIKLFVVYLFLLETISTAAAIGTMYEPLVIRYGSVHGATHVPILLPAQPILTVAISTPVQIFIAWRIMIISKSKLLAGVIVLLALLAMGGGIWTTQVVAAAEIFASLPFYPALSWLVTSAVADVLITTTLSLTLYYRKTGVSRTDSLVNRLIRLTLQTGLIPAICAVVEVATMVASSTTIFFIWDYSLSKLYANALISTLNARAGWGHLVNGNAMNNVLFGGRESHGLPPNPQPATITTSSIAGNDLYFAHSRGVPPFSGIYELDPATLASEKPGDLERGISITKEVNRVEDPLPHTTQ